MPHMTAQDKQFQAENDARTLVEAAKIKGDKTRRAAALKSISEQKKALAKVEKETKAS
jgi:hypothetical protein